MQNFDFFFSKLPTWVQSYVPKIFYITEKAWNYYPYTITEYNVSKILLQFELCVHFHHYYDVKFYELSR